MAGLLDGVLPLLLGSTLLLTPASLPLIAMITLIVFVFWNLIWLAILGDTTPGKKIMRLRLRGDGCVMCRELRKVLPLALLSLTSVAFYHAPFGLSSVTAGTAKSAHSLILPLIGWFILGFAQFIYALVVLTAGDDGQRPYDTATGFRVEHAP